MSVTRYIIWLNLSYHIIKVVIPTSTLITCMRFDASQATCSYVTDHRIRIMLVCDCIYATTLFLYEIFCMAKLIYFSWTYSRHESRQHMPYFVFNSLGLFLALPIVINDLLFFALHTASYGDWRIGYYLDWFAKTLPSAVYILTKKNEDCFSCFNRLAPQTYSVIQYSPSELLSQGRSSVSTHLRDSKKFFAEPLFLNLNASENHRYDPLVHAYAQDNQNQLVFYPCRHGCKDYCAVCEQ